MLGDRHARAGGDEGGRGRYVERAESVAAGADDIDGTVRRMHPQAHRTHRARRACHFGDVGPVHLHRGQHRGKHHLAHDLAVHHFAEGPERLVLGEVHAFLHLDKRFHYHDRTSFALSMKFRI